MQLNYLIIFLLLISTGLQAQTNDLRFDKRFIDCENKWVSFPMNNDNSYNYGFIYLDIQAGLTLNYEGTYKIDDNGKFIPTKQPAHNNLKIRLQPNNTLISIIPESKFEELKIDTIPSWLSIYQTKEDNINRLFRLGFTYNAWNQCDKALVLLKQVRKINPKYNDLTVEIAYSYNCMGDFEKAEKILEDEIKSNVYSAYVNKEYIFTLIRQNKIEKAIAQYNQAKNNLKDKQYDLENYYNIIGYYYTQKDKVNFEKWYAEITNFKSSNNVMLTNVEKMRIELSK